MQPHIRAFVDRAVTFTTCPGLRRHPAGRARPVVQDQRDQHRRRVRDADQRPGRVGRAGSAEPSVAPLLATLSRTLDSFAEIGLGYLSLDRPVEHPVRRRGAAGEDDPPARLLAHRRHLRLRRADRSGCTRTTSQRMNELLLRLRDKGNTVLVVEHKPEAIAIADHVVDLGPGAGAAGGTRLLRGHRRGPARQRHRHRPPPGRPGQAQGVGARPRPGCSRSAARARTTCRT